MIAKQNIEKLYTVVKLGIHQQADNDKRQSKLACTFRDDYTTYHDSFDVWVNRLELCYVE
jgi:hypothetical protein